MSFLPVANSFGRITIDSTEDKRQIQANALIESYRFLTGQLIERFRSKIRSEERICKLGFMDPVTSLQLSLLA